MGHLQDSVIKKIADASHEAEGWNGCEDCKTHSFVRIETFYKCVHCLASVDVPHPDMTLRDVLYYHKVLSYVTFDHGIKESKKAQASDLMVIIKQQNTKLDDAWLTAEQICKTYNDAASS